VDHRGIEAGGNWSQVFDLVRQVDRSTACTEDGTTDAVSEGLDQPERR
jgi:hypothetical protein